MTDILVKLFVKDYKDVEKVSVRTAYGVLASGVGIFCNVLLTVAKMVIGILLHSVSVTADAFNNLSDAGSSIIGMIGVKMAEKPADKEHPFGHGRLEYIAALIVSFLVIEVGFTFFKNAIVKIREPEELKFSLVSILILVLSIGVKLWLAMFNRKLGEKISSQVMMATAADALGDVITTAAIETLKKTIDIMIEEDKRLAGVQNRINLVIRHKKTGSSFFLLKPDDRIKIGRRFF